MSKTCAYLPYRTVRDRARPSHFSNYQRLRLQHTILNLVIMLRFLRTYDRAGTKVKSRGNRQRPKVSVEQSRRGSEKCDGFAGRREWITKSCHSGLGILRTLI